MAHLLVVDDSEFDCELENDLLQVSTLTQELRQKISERGLLSEADCLRFATAVDEALMNAYFHGNLEIDSKLRDIDSNAFHELAKQRCLEDKYRSRHIHVHVHIDAGQISITIRDDGRGFDQSRLPDPTKNEYLDRAHGRGLLLMRAFADTVRYNNIGNEVTLVKGIGCVL